MERWWRESKKRTWNKQDVTRKFSFKKTKMRVEITRYTSWERTAITNESLMRLTWLQDCEPVWSLPRLRTHKHIQTILGSSFMKTRFLTGNRFKTHFAAIPVQYKQRERETKYQKRENWKAVHVYGCCGGGGGASASVDSALAERAAGEAGKLPNALPERMPNLKRSWLDNSWTLALSSLWYCRQRRMKSCAIKEILNNFHCHCIM